MGGAIVGGLCTEGDHVIGQILLADGEILGHGGSGAVVAAGGNGLYLLHQ